MTTQIKCHKFKNKYFAQNTFLKTEDILDEILEDVRKSNEQKPDEI